MRSVFAAWGATAVLTSAAMGAVFVPGRYYTPIDGGVIVEWNPDLQETRRFTVPGVSSATGAVFSGHDTLVFVGYRQGSEQVIEIDANGAILRSYATGNGLLRGSYIDHDAAHDRYVFADDHRLTVLDANLTFVGATGADFQRASGVAIDAAASRVYATDQFTGGVRSYTLDANPLFTGTTPYNAFVATGLDVAPNHDLIVTQFGGGRVDRLTTPLGSVTPIVTGLGYGRISDVRALSSGEFLVVGYSSQLFLYSATGQLLRSSVLAGDFGDSVAIYVPAPGQTCVLGIAGMTMTRRRRTPRA